MSEEFERRASDLLHQSVARLDARTLSRLNQARQHALAEAGARAISPWRRWFGSGWLVPAGALTAAALVAVTLWSGPRGVDPAGPLLRAEAPTAFEDIELLADAGDALELVTEGDAAFYEWAENEIDAGAAANGPALGS